jgi:hypothetical protein
MPFVMQLEGPKLGRAVTPGEFLRTYQSLEGDRIPGGRAAGMSPMQFNQLSLAKGTLVEMEHTGDWRMAREIAMDHLVEDPDYYVKLRSIHLDGLRGLFDPVRAHSGIAIVGLLFGVWLAGTSPGRSVTTKARSLIKRKR